MVEKCDEDAKSHFCRRELVASSIAAFRAVYDSDDSSHLGTIVGKYEQSPVLKRSQKFVVS